MPDRFSASVAATLTESGWTPGRSIGDQAEQAVRYVEDRVGSDGARTTSFPAAEDVIREFGGIVVVQDGPGADLRLRPFVVDPSQVAATCETLADFGSVIGQRLFPIGMEGDHESIVAIAENGHVFAIDHAGEWHLGDTMDDAIATLVTGVQPPRVDSQGNW